MPFVKVKTSLRDNVRKLTVSRSAALAYYDGLTLVEELSGDGGRLGYFEYRDLGALTTKHLAIKLHVSPGEMKKIADELVGVGLWERDGDVLCVPRFAEATTPADPRAAERMRRYRSRQQQNIPAETPSKPVTDTVTETVGDGVTKRVTKRVTAAVTLPVTDTSRCAQTLETYETLETSSVVTHVTTAHRPEKTLNPPVMPNSLPATLPSEILPLKRVAVEFLAAFANVTSPEALKKHGEAYVEVLAIFRSRGISTTDTWRAFSDAWLSRDGKPLFGSSAKKAVAFIAPRDVKPPNGTRRVADDGSIDGLPYTVPEEQRA